LNEKFNGFKKNRKRWKMYQHQNNILENDEVLFERENEIEEKLQSLMNFVK